MKYAVESNRTVRALERFDSTQNENKVTELKFIFPNEYKDFNKKIVFITPDNSYWEELIDDACPITQNLSKYRKINFYIWLTKDEQDFRTKMMPLEFYPNVDADEILSDEEKEGIKSILKLVDSEIEKVKDLQIEVDNSLRKMNNISISGSRWNNVTEITITDKEGRASKLYISDGEKGDTGVGIQSIEPVYISSDDNGTNEFKINLTNGNSYNFTTKNGSKGSEALINGVNTLRIVEGKNITIEQTNGTLKINAEQYDDASVKQNIESLFDITAETDRDLVNLDNRINSAIEELHENEESLNHLDDVKVDINVNNLLNYYLKEETYTKQEVLDLIRDIEKVHLRKVNELPQNGEENIIYLVNNNEYVWIDGAYELFGTTQIDLSDYYTKEEINETNQNFVTTGFLIGTLNGYEPKLPASTDLMFQSVMYGDGESGYRKYRNGMLEQWGIATSGANGEVEFTMHQAHIDTRFSVFVEPREMGNFFHYAIPSANQKFKCRIQTRDSVNIAVKFQWRSWGRWK